MIDKIKFWTIFIKSPLNRISWVFLEPIDAYSVSFCVERTVGLIRLRYPLSCRPLTLIVSGNGHLKRTIREAP